MVNLSPIPQALVPANSTAADLITAPNYDEFLKSSEIWPYIANNRHNVLGITLPGSHPEKPYPEGSPMALARAIVNMEELKESDSTVEKKNVLYIYEICGKAADSIRQIGIGGYAKTAEIRTEDEGVILRNEQVMMDKVKGRMNLIEATNATIGVVNCAVEDNSGELLKALEVYADSLDCNYQVTDENEDTHKIWLLRGDIQQQFIDLLAKEPNAYVADGNHRSAAAAMLGDEHFLSVFFPAERMRIGPYNRLVKANPPAGGLLELYDKLERSFMVYGMGNEAFQPQNTHEIGLFSAYGWTKLMPHRSVYKGRNPVEQIDSDIVQRELLS